MGTDLQNSVGLSTCAPVSVAQQPFGFLLICGIGLDLLALLFRSRHVCPVLVCPSLRRHSSSATRTTDSVRPLVLCSRYGARQRTMNYLVSYRTRTFINLCLAKK